MDEYISREEVVRYLKGYSEKELNKGGNFGMITSSVLDKAERAISEMPSADVQPVKHEQRIDYEKLIGIFGTLCDYMVDNCKCDVFCPYADTKDKDDECEAWRTIQKIRREDSDNDDKSTIQETLGQ